MVYIELARSLFVKMCIGIKTMFSNLLQGIDTNKITQENYNLLKYSATAKYREYRGI